MPDAPWEESVPEQNPRLYEHLGEPPETPPRIGTQQNPSWVVPQTKQQFRGGLSEEEFNKAQPGYEESQQASASRAMTAGAHNLGQADPSKHALPGNVAPTIRTNPARPAQVGGSFLSVSTSPTFGAPRLASAPPGTPEAAHAEQAQSNVTNAQGQHNTMMQRVNGAVERQGGDAALAKKVFRNYAYLRFLRGGAHGLLHGLAEGE